MKYASLTDSTYLVRLEPGDDIRASIAQFCTDHHIANASVSGIGSIADPELGCYSIETKEYTTVQLKGIYELTSLLGNVGLIDGKPEAHLHITVADQQMRVQGGHLMKAVCSAVTEMVLSSYPTQFIKEQEDRIGLKMWQLEESPVAAA